MQNFISVHRWDNNSQSYMEVGSLYHDPEALNGAVSFFYEQEYISHGGAPLDPRGLRTDKYSGRHVMTYGDGILPLYFQQFIPGEFAQSLLSSAIPEWNDFSQFQKLATATQLFGDHHAIQLNAHLEQINTPIVDSKKALELAKAIVKLDIERLENPLTHELCQSLCSMPGNRPKLDFIKPESGSRYVLKPNFSSHYDEAKMRVVMCKLEQEAGIDSVKTGIVSDGEIRLSIQSNFKHMFIQDDDSKALLKFNTVPFDALLCEGPVLSPSPSHSYKDAAEVIDKYSSAPKKDKELLLLRGLFSASVNHTTNSLSNLALCDLGDGYWRLAPANNTLPNPFPESSFELRFGDHEVSRKHFAINQSFACRFAESLSLTAEQGIASLEKVNTALKQTKEISKQVGLNNKDIDALKASIGNSELFSVGTAETMVRGKRPSM